MAQTFRYPLFVKRDLDGFFGLFIDNLSSLYYTLAPPIARPSCGSTDCSATIRLIALPVANHATRQMAAILIVCITSMPADRFDQAGHDVIVPGPSAPFVRQICACSPLTIMLSQ